MRRWARDGGIERDAIEQRPRRARVAPGCLEIRRTAGVRIRRTAQRQLAGGTVPDAIDSYMPTACRVVFRFCFATSADPH